MIKTRFAACILVLVLFGLGMVEWNGDNVFAAYPQPPAPYPPPVATQTAVPTVEPTATTAPTQTAAPTVVITMTPNPDATPTNIQLVEARATTGDPSYGVVVVLLLLLGLSLVVVMARRSGWRGNGRYWRG